MARGSKDAYSSKQKRKAEHIESSYVQQGVPEKKAEAIAWATVNKQSGGGDLAGAGKTKPETEKAKARRDSARQAVKTKRDKASPNALETHSKQSLLSQAREKNIAGRSAMNKQELILALRKG